MASWIRWSCAILIVAAISLRADPQAEAACQGLKGTFLQLTEAQLARPPTEWRQLFDELRSLGINALFLQWTVLDRKPLFRAARHETTDNTPLATILDLAAQFRDSRLVRFSIGFELLGRDQAISGAT